jgi:serine protease Do
LGYYDDDHTRIQRKKGSRGGYFLTSLAGALIGGLLIIFSTPLLSEYGLLPYKVEPQNGPAQPDSREESPGASKNISVDVVTEVSEAVEKTGSAVVGITNIQTGGGFWFGSVQGQEAGTGSGVIYKKEGDNAYVVTNYHVIEGANELEVSLSDGTKVPATLKGGDEWTDLAVLEISADNVETVAEFGDSDNLRIGEPAIAIGNPLGLRFSNSVTQGIISGLERAIPVDINQDGQPDWQAEVLQTDAAINPGNSGGALINIDGQVIGINSMKIAQSAVEGIGLAIPINYAIPIIEDLEEHGTVKRPYMGIQLGSVNQIPERYQQSELKLPKDVNYGVAVLDVTNNSPAQEAGLRAYDVIVELDGEKIEDVVALRKHLYNEKEPGEEMQISFYRDGKLQETTMTLVEDKMTIEQ